ncbi:MAG TPA: replicative DNA helicase [Actinophytocola sp.]|nr:replicative DNA helicase [Actinophytocola sp.]
MALTDDRPPAAGPAEGALDRQPPQDLAAEQSVLGGMMLSKDAIADVVEVLRPGDFYRPAHQSVYDCVLDLYGRGEPADAVTVSAELERRGELRRVGGAPYLHTLIATVPTAANAGYYAEIVAEKAILRRLVEAGTRIVQLGYAGAEGADVNEVVDRAQSSIYEVTERRMSEDYVALEELLQPTMDEIDAIASRGGSSLGVPTGFEDLDAVTNGLHPGQMIIVAARPGIGKALALNTPLPTPTGWTTMGDVMVGDQLLGADGRPTRVVAATEAMTNRPCYEVEFSDGTTVVADGQHQWQVSTRAGRRRNAEIERGSYRATESLARVRAEYDKARTQPDELVSFREAVALAGTEFRHTMRRVVTTVWRGTEAPRNGNRPAPVFSKLELLDALQEWITSPKNAALAAEHAPTVTTEQMRERLRCSDGRPNFAVANTAALELPDADLLVPPYTLGAWLGDGHFASARITSADPQVALNIENEGVVVTPSESSVNYGITACLRTLEVLGNKHIPDEYLRASERQRRALLAGLLDTDGTVTNGGSVSFAVTDERLAKDVYELVVGLGYRCSTTTRAVRGRSVATSTCYQLTFATDDEVFRLERKVLAHKRNRRATSTRRSDVRYVADIRPVASVPVRCVEVDADDHLYLAGRSMVPTHNSTLGLDFTRSCSVKRGMTSVIFSLEMSRTEIVMRMLSAEAKIRLADMRGGRMTDDDWTRLARRMSEVSEAPLFVDDSPNMTMMEIRAKARRLKQRHDLRVIVIDYLQLMTSGKKVESRQLEVSEFSRQIKLLAKELEVPIIALSQLNRGPEQRSDKRPMLSDLRESGSLEQDADMVILLHREDLYERESTRPGEADLIVAKHRNGPTRDVTVAFQGHYSRFVDMAH